MREAQVPDNAAFFKYIALPCAAPPAVLGKKMPNRAAIVLISISLLLGGVGMRAAAQMIPSTVSPNPRPASSQTAPSAPTAGSRATPPPTPPPGSPLPPPPAPPLRSRHPYAPRLKAQANLVNLTVSVVTRHGRFVPGLKADDFRVYEDHRLQTIRFFSVEGHTPLTLGMLLDTSPSQVHLLGDEQRLGAAFFQSLLKKDDLAFAVSFDSDIRLLADFTASPARLARGLNRAHIGGGEPSSVLINPGPFPAGGAVGGTRLWDAIIESCNEKLADQPGRKALIVITDGQDQGSHHSWRQAERALLATNTVLYAMIAADPGFYYQGGSFYTGAGNLRHIARDSGGAAYNAGRHMRRAFNRISEELRNQYTLAYVPTHPMNGGYYRIKIKLVKTVRAHRKVRTRKGYYAIAG